MLRTVGFISPASPSGQRGPFSYLLVWGCCCSCAAHKAPWHHFIPHDHFHHKPSFPVRDHTITVNICCRVKLALKVWSQAEEQQGHEAGSCLEAFHFLVTSRLPHFLKWAFLAIINKPRPGADAPFPCVQTALCPVPARIYIPTAWVVGHMSWVILAKHVSLEGLCNTSAAPWLTSPSHLLLPDAPGRGCTHREGAGFPQPPLSHSALPREVWENRVKPLCAAEALSAPCSAVSSSSMVSGGVSLFPWREETLTHFSCFPNLMIKTSLWSQIFFINQT